MLLNLTHHYCQHLVISSLLFPGYLLCYTSPWEIASGLACKKGRSKRNAHFPELTTFPTLGRSPHFGKTSGPIPHPLCQYPRLCPCPCHCKSQTHIFARANVFAPARPHAQASPMPMPLVMPISAPVPTLMPSPVPMPWLMPMLGRGMSMGRRVQASGQAWARALAQP